VYFILEDYSTSRISLLNLKRRDRSVTNVWKQLGRMLVWSSAAAAAAAAAAARSVYTLPVGISPQSRIVFYSDKSSCVSVPVVLRPLRLVTDHFRGFHSVLEFYRR